MFQSYKGTKMDLVYLLEEIKNILTNNNLKLACAESCTGGLVSSYLTDVSGSAAYIEQNFVTYSNEAKSRFLGVKKQTLDTFGAVSEQVAYQMARGLLQYADCSVATTGILGPTGGSKEKPIGLCYMGFAIKNKEIIKVIKFQSQIECCRVEIKKDIAFNAIKNLAGFLNENVAKCKET